MSAPAMTRSLRSVFASISVFKSLKRRNIIISLWTSSNRNREGWLLNAEVEYLLLYLKGSREGSGGGERFNYVCTSTTTESADSRAQHAHSSGTAKSRTTPQSGQQQAMGLPSCGIDQTLEFSIHLPSVMLPVCLPTPMPSHVSQRKDGALIILGPAACRERNAGVAQEAWVYIKV